MTYVKTTWVDNQPPDITATRLNKIETGIKDAHDGYSAAQAAAAAAQSSGDTHAASIANPHAVTSKQVGAGHWKNAKKRGAVGDGVTDDTAVLQLLLDEIRDEGGGVLYLPNDGGTIYKTNGLWVPSNCHVISDGATVKCTAVGAQRNQSPDFDPIYSTGAFTMLRQVTEGITAPVADVLIEGVRIDCGAAVDGLHISSSRTTIRNVVVTGTPRDCVNIDARAANGTPEQVYLSNCLFENGKRNCVSVICVSACWIKDCIIRNSSGTSPEFDPACGIDIEPNWSGDAVKDITIQGCVVTGNQGAGIGLILVAAGDGLPATNADGISIVDCVITGNGSNSGGGATTQHGVLVSQGAAGQGVRIVGNTIKSNTGYGVQHSSYAGLSIITANDLRSNTSGAINAAPGGSYTTGNLN